MYHARDFCRGINIIWSRYVYLISNAISYSRAFCEVERRKGNEAVCGANSRKPWRDARARFSPLSRPFLLEIHTSKEINASFANTMYNSTDIYLAFIIREKCT